MAALKKTHVKLDEHLRTILTTLAHRKHVSKSDVIREGILEIAQQEGLPVWTEPQPEQCEEDHI